MGEVDLKRPNEVLEVMLRAGAAGVSFFYVLGFLIVNVHLAEFGIFDPDLIRARYVAAGALATFLIVFTILGAVAIFAEFVLAWHAQPRKNPRWVRWSRAVLVPIFFLIVLLAVSGMLVAEHGEGRGSLFVALTAHFDTLGSLLLVAFVASMPAGTVMRLIDDSRSDQPLSLLRIVRSLPPDRQFAAAFEAAFSLFAGFLGIILYATILYPTLDPAYGGGAPRLACVLPADADESVWATVGLETRASGGLVGPVRVIDGTAEWLVLTIASDPSNVTVPGVESIQLPTSAVRAVLNLKRRVSSSEPSCVLEEPELTNSAGNAAS